METLEHGSISDFVVRLRAPLFLQQMLQTATGGRIVSLRDLVCNCSRGFLFVGSHGPYGG